MELDGTERPSYWESPTPRCSLIQCPWYVCSVQSASSLSNLHMCSPEDVRQGDAIEQNHALKCNYVPTCTYMYKSEVHCELIARAAKLNTGIDYIHVHCRQ